MSDGWEDIYPVQLQPASKESQISIIINSIENIMDKLTITETIIALETAALDAWHNGNPQPLVDY